MGIRIIKFVFLFISISFLLILSSCSEDVIPPKQTEDYFPINSNYVYKFESNAFSNNQDSMVTFDMKIDEYNFTKGDFLGLQVKLSNMDKFGAILGLKDSGNVIYSLGDSPPEGLFPMFKHKYNDSEVTTENITFEGKTYSAKRIDITRDNVTVSWWFVNGIGLVKEESPNGVSLFNDNHYGDNYLIKTVLVSFKK